MNLKVYTPERYDTDGNVIQEKSDRVLRGLVDFHVEFPRNTFTVTHRMNNGALVTETLELHRLFEEGALPDFLLRSGTEPESAIGEFLDPTTVSTAGVTGVRRQGEVTVTEPTGDQENLSGNVTNTDGAPKTTGKQPLSAEQQSVIERMRAITDKTRTSTSTETEQEKARLAEKDGAVEGLDTSKQPNTTDVPVASATPHLLDPTTQPTDKITGGEGEDFMKVPNPSMNRQGPSTGPSINDRP